VGLSVFSLPFSNVCTGDGLVRPIDLGQNPNIRIISLEAPDRRIGAALKSLLSHMVSTNIERINLIFFKPTDLPDWKEIDAILDSKGFVTLRRIMLYVLDSQGADDAWLLKPLRSLNSKGIWHVHSKVHHIHSIWPCSCRNVTSSSFIWMFTMILRSQGGTE
jgi:hypothetical protein